MEMRKHIRNWGADAVLTATVAILVAVATLELLAAQAVIFAA